MSESFWDERFDKASEMSWEAEDEGVDVGPEENDEEELSQDAQSLLYLGYLTETFDFGGNEFKIATFPIGDELTTHLLSKPYSGTEGSGLAWATACAAAAVREVNGRAIIAPLGEDDVKKRVERQYAYISTRWFWPTIHKIYNEYQKLLARQQTAIEEIEKKSSPSLVTSEQ